jgi:hypothetical protein
VLAASSAGWHRPDDDDPGFLSRQHQGVAQDLGRELSACAIHPAASQLLTQSFD